jgi:AcrR family transcriptional regulator
MVRPRFAKLPPEQQQAILHAALQEFAAHGFHDASLNRVIDAAGISKGSMYYYFDGKEDLYAYLAQTELERLFARMGPFPVPNDADPDAFWSTLADYYLQLMTALAASPQLAALIRSWIAVAGNPALQQAQQQMEQAVLPWMTQALAAGQRVGAIRTDLPSALLIAVILGMGQAMDTWLITQPPDQNDLPRLIAALIDMMRRAVQPQAHS